MAKRELLKVGGTAAGGALALAACGPLPGAPPPRSGEVTGNVSVLFYSTTDTDLARMQQQEAAANKALPSVKTTMIPTNHWDIVGKFTTMSAGGAPPDLTWAGIEVAQYAASSAVLALDDLIARDRGFPSREYYSQAVEGYRYKGRTYGLPYGLTIEVIAYNKMLFDKNGVKYPTRDWTIADFVSMAKRMTSPPGTEPPVWGGWIPQLYTSIWMHGGQVYDRDFTKAVIDEPLALSGFQFYYDQGFGAHKFAPTTRTSHREGLMPYFGEGTLAMATFQPYIIPMMREKYPSVEWDLVTVPWNAGKTRGTWLSGQGYAMSSGTKNRDAAWEVLKQLCGRESQTSFYLPQVSTVPALRSVAEGPFVGAVPGKQVKSFLDSIEFATPWGRHPAIFKTDTPVQDAWNEVREGRKSVRDAASEAAQRLNLLLRETSG